MMDGNTILWALQKSIRYIGDFRLPIFRDRGEPGSRYGKFFLK